MNLRKCFNLKYVTSHCVNILHYLFWNIFFKEFGYGSRVSIFAKIVGHKNIVIKKGVKIYSNCYIYCRSNDKNTKLIMHDASRIKEYAVIELIEPNSYLHLGSRTVIQYATRIQAGGKVYIGNSVRVAGGSTIVAESHNYKDKTVKIIDQGMNYRGVEISDDVWIGANCCILDGSKIPEGVVIGANSIVLENSDIDVYGVYVGSPIKKISKRST